jgi:hypothetical protein
VPSQEIEEFAKILVREVRDAAIESSDRQLQGPATNPVARRWKESAQSGNLESIASVLIPDIVDDTLFYLLNTIDQGLLQLALLVRMIG